MYRIVEKRVLNPQVTLMKIDAPAIAKKAQPGQFIILRVDEHGERIPLTISGYDREEGTVTIIFQIVGKTTSVLNEMEQGQSISDFVGPLGVPTHSDDSVKRVAVIGGGNSGVEAAIDLAGIVEHVTLLEFAPEMKADQVLQDKLRSLKNVDIILNAQTTEVKGDGSKVVGLEYRDRVSGDIHNIELAGIFVQIGLLPNTNWLEGAVERNRMGEIIIDAKCETNVKGVFAAGDCTTVPYKQIIIATGEGAKASLSAFDYLIRTKTA